MGASFRVDVPTLDALLRDLRSSRDDMRAALGAMRDIGPRSSGTVELDHACDEFHESWDNALDKLVEGTRQIEERLTATRANYAATEEALREAFARGTASGGGAGAGGGTPAGGGGAR